MDEKDKKDASQQIDEDEQLENLDASEAENQEVEEGETKAEDEESSVEGSEVEGEKENEESSQKTQEKPSRRENLRIQQLIAKLKKQEQSVLSDKKTDDAESLDYRKAIEAPDSVYEQLETDRKSFGSKQYQAGLEQAKSIQFHTRLELDAPKIASKYPQFDPEAPEFNPSVANAINEWYLATTGYDPEKDTVANANVRYAEFVEGIMELADKVADKKTEATKKNLTKQVASTGLRPDGSSAKRLNLNQAPENMTDEELEAVIGHVIPTKKR